MCLPTTDTERVQTLIWQDLVCQLFSSSEKRYQSTRCPIRISILMRNSEGSVQGPRPKAQGDFCKYKNKKSNCTIVRFFLTKPAPYGLPRNFFNSWIHHPKHFHENPQSVHESLSICKYLLYRLSFHSILSSSPNNITPNYFTFISPHIVSKNTRIIKSIHQTSINHF